MMTRAAWLAEGYARRIRLRTAEYEKATAEHQAELEVFADACRRYLRKRVTWIRPDGETIESVK